MPRVNFFDYQYYPALLCSVEEHMGYAELSGPTKDALLPILEISRRHSSMDFEPSIASIREIARDRPFLLDLNKEVMQQPRGPRDANADRSHYERAMQLYESHQSALDTLLDATDGFAVWRSLVETFQNAVPVLQFTDALAERRQILRQAMNLARGGGSIAIRFTPLVDESLYDTIAQITAVIDSPDQLLIIIDSGQGRTMIQRRAEQAAQSIARVHSALSLAERPLIRAVNLSNSFMRPNHNGLLDWENHDWRLWSEASEINPLIFGDYGATGRFQSAFIPSDYRATVVLPQDESWLIYRHPNMNDPDGWIEGARRIRDAGALESAPECWGTTLIRTAAAGNIAGVSSARFWRAAKVNIHLTRQSGFAANAADDVE